MSTLDIEKMEESSAVEGGDALGKTKNKVFKIKIGPADRGAECNVKFEADTGHCREFPGTIKTNGAIDINNSEADKTITLEFRLAESVYEGYEFNSQSFSFYFDPVASEADASLNQFGDPVCDSSWQAGVGKPDQGEFAFEKTKDDGRTLIVKDKNNPGTWQYTLTLFKKGNPEESVLIDPPIRNSSKMSY
ncbi:hypothetical protein [Biformimicrobium ophioploci]|uniref:Uncharacterized protein n=1 Tax=Biformimicrobium ophioploci TaxID=3036711 RepID=A0ABQ6LWF3_9GAMM|nr:hypothetical protein [Microbulbifer sp. NKW57]GMG86362.1 hypothetical protein MNKW57_06830 [Microbulbifer sp. NKW57]